MSDNNFIHAMPVLLPPSRNGNGHHPPEPISLDDLPEPTSLRQVDLHALRLYGIGADWEHPLVNPKLVTLLNAHVDPIALLTALGPTISAAVLQIDPYHLPPLTLTVDDLCRLFNGGPDKTAAKSLALKLVHEAARLGLTDLLVLMESMLTNAHLPQSFIRKWEQAVKEQRDRFKTEQQAAQQVLRTDLLAQQQDESPSWPYSTREGRMYYDVINPKSGRISSVLIADFTVQIAETIQPEHGSPRHHVTGVTWAGKPVSLEIDAGDFQDTKKLMAALSIATAHDPRAGIAPGAGYHLAMAIHRLSAPEVPLIALYQRTGWANHRFLIAGRELPGTRLDLPSDLPYQFSATADLTQGLQALMHLVASVGPQNSLPALMTFFAAPLAEQLGLRDERYVTMIRGRTGKFKTSWSQLAMCLYGSDFAAERHLLKWGDGATTNAIEALAALSHDLPFLLDNYKPNTGEGERGLIKLVHRMAEGGGRRRLDRNATLRPTPEIYSWLVVTGEDTPQNDTATSARMLWITFDEQPPEAAKQLSLAQAGSGHLSAVGQCWIEWLENPQSAPIIQEWRQKFGSIRQHYLDLILKINPEAINGNPRRIAQNLAVNCLTWEILRRCPAIGPYINNQAAYFAGLQAITQTMAIATIQSNPGVVFVHALRELLSSARALLIDPNYLPPTPDDSMGQPQTGPASEPGIVGLSEINQGDTARRVIGYVAPNGGAYLFPELARAAVENLIGTEALAQATSTALYKRLDELGYLGSKGKDGTLIFKKIEGKSKRVLHLNATALEPLLDSSRPPTDV